MAQIERPVVVYKNTSLRFRISDEDEEMAFLRQYYSMYRVRLAVMKERVIKAAKSAGKYQYKPIEAVEKETEPCLIIGTIIKRLAKRPGILKELARDEHLIPEDDMPDIVDSVEDERSYATGQDYLEIEDEKQIIRLGEGISLDSLATGCVVGLYGKKGEEDDFEVEDIVWPEAALPLKWPIAKPKAVIAILSGLELTGVPALDAKTILNFTMFTRWLNGELCDTEKSKDRAAKVERVLITGNSLAFNAVKETSSAARLLRLIPRDGTTPTVEACQQVDRLLSNLTSKMRVDIMSGAGDPCTQLWPQQPIHRACLPMASCNGKALGLRTNPYSFILGGVDLLATSGQNVSDVLRMSSIGNSLDVMQSLLSWQHIAPTAPDTIDAFPMDKRDPLIMERRPHVFICGNQAKSDYRWIESTDGKTLLISVSRFSRAPVITLLDMESMQVSYKAFGTNLDDPKPIINDDPQFDFSDSDE